MIGKKVLVNSPGRINLIGEHIDYNGGHVLPAAIDKKIKIELELLEGDICFIESKTIDKKFTLNLKNLEKSKNQWENYIIGSLKFILDKKKSIKAFKCKIYGDLPIGAGVSSSSSLICGFIKGIDTINSLKLTNNQIIQISKGVEHKYIGLTGGIMDQFTIVNGKKDSLLFLDCKNEKYSLIKSDFGEYKFLLLNTNVNHNLVESSYNNRVTECKEVVQIISKNKDQYLCDILPDQLQKFKNRLSNKLFKRASHVLNENKRVKESVTFIQNKDFISLGKLMYESHASLKNLYNVSCEELDFTVDFSRNYSYILGSRMMGGGFGGCTINLIHSNNINEYIDLISREYYKKFNLNLSSIITKIDDGVICTKI